MSNDYLNTLFEDLAAKQKSIAGYQERGRKNLQKLHQVTFEWIGQLRKKYEVIEKFRRSRDRIVPSHFAVEKAPGTPAQDQHAEDAKKLEQTIKDTKSQMDYLFQQAMKDLQVETASYQELQELAGHINEQFEEIFAGAGM